MSKMIGLLEVFDTIKEKLDSKKPFALIRIGDGESMVLHGNTSYVYNRQFGYVPKDTSIIDMLADAYNYADIIGVPTERHKEISNGWGEAEVILTTKSPQTKKITRCSIDIHIEFLKSDLFYPLINGKEIFYISGRYLDDKISHYFNCEVESFIVPPEIMFESEKTHKPHYPDVFNDVLAWIHTTDFNGKLCLVGAGILGKIYTAELKKYGAVAFDIGCVFDLWAGLRTRGQGRGAGAENNDFKL